MIAGINHITLSVHDLSGSVIFYTKILGCKLHAKWDKGAYLSTATLWLCLTVDRHTRDMPLPEYTHIAFHVNSQDFQALTNKIIDSGATIWKDNISEGDSLYFLDPNGHKLEIHTNTLQDRLAACKKSPYSGMEFFNDEL
jgi:catechol 2,3-dioxygenase-like lactoylglutathione lyase family enzyme